MNGFRHRHDNLAWRCERLTSMRGKHIIHDKYVAFVVVETHSGISVT